MFLKDPGLEPHLGALLTGMLVAMTDRGPDAAGIASYGSGVPGRAKLTLQSGDPAGDFSGLTELAGADAPIAVKDSHCVMTLPANRLAAVRAALADHRPEITVMSAGAGIEIYKEVGLPRDVTARFDLAAMAGTHGIGHTRMATATAVTTQGAHPFSTGADQCLVHNGSLSNHNAVRRVLKRAGMTFQTENDTEAAAAFLTHRIAQGDSLGAAMQATLTGLDGFFTFVVGTANGFGVVRDPIA